MKSIALTVFILLLSISSFAAIGSIIGNASVCVANVDTLIDTTSGGIWTSNNTAVASVGSITGIVAGLSAGTTIITYTVGGSYKTLTVFVKPAPSPIFGPTIMCLYGSVTLYDTTAGGGTWYFGDGGAGESLDYWGYNSAIVGSHGFDIHTGFLTFIDTAGCATSPVGIEVIVPPIPPITGDTILDVDSTTTLHGVGVGILWTSSNTSVATIDSSGVVVGISPGTTTIAYYYGCIVTATLTVLIPSGVPTVSAANIGAVTILPNPATSSLTITSTDKITNLTITNLLGQTVYCNYYHNEEVRVDVSGLPAGMYLVRINGMTVRKFVKE